MTTANTTPTGGIETETGARAALDVLRTDPAAILAEEGQQADVGLPNASGGVTPVEKRVRLGNPAESSPGRDVKRKLSDSHSVSTLGCSPTLDEAPALIDCTISNTTLWITASGYALAAAVSRTAAKEQQAIEQGIKLIQRMMKGDAPVRVIGVGRARLAVAIPANRLFHFGAEVHVVHELTPLPNTNRGGYLVAGSASGKTKDVLEIMRTTRNLNRGVRILGFADSHAQEFGEMCDVFIGMHRESGIPNPIHALADQGEYVISELFDRMIVVAAHRLALTDEDARDGHEDLCTGPYSRADLLSVGKRQV